MKKLLLAFVFFGITAASVKAQLENNSMQTGFTRVVNVLALISAAQSTTANYHLSFGAGVQAELFAFVGVPPATRKSRRLVSDQRQNV